MNKVFAILVLVTVLQFAHSQETQSKVTNCIKKMTGQIGSLKDSKELPKCVDQDALKQVMEKSKMFKDLYKTIIDSCKADFQNCGTIIAQNIQKEQEDIKVCIMEMVKLMTGAFSGCLETLKENMSNIDDYIANGCEDPKP